MVKVLMCLFAAANAVVDGDGVLMQTHDASASLSMAGLQVDSQFAKLEESLHSTLLGVLKDPQTMSRLPAGWLASIVTQMQEMRDAVEAENAKDQVEISTASSAVAKCNADRTAEFVAVDKLKGQVSTGRNTHATCRNSHVGLVNLAQTTCADFESSSTLSCDKKPNCACDTAGCATGKANVACQAKLATWLTTYQRDLINKDSDCDTKNSDVASKHTQCNQAQSNFESYHCELSQKLLATCLELDNCYSTNKATYESLEVAVKVKEVSQKKMWVAEKKISCYLNVFAKAEAGGTLVDADITNCVQIQINADHLNIQYASLPAKDACDVSLAYWQTNEYDVLVAKYLQPTVQCCIDSMLTTTTTTTTTKLKKACLKVITGTGGPDAGTMLVTIYTPTGGAETVPSRRYSSGSTVIDKCWDGDSINMMVDVKGSTNDGWGGSITLSADGGNTYAPMTCKTCGNTSKDSSSDSMYVDGNADGRHMGSTHCDNGATCRLVP
jgi:hypothetical protein